MSTSSAKQIVQMVEGVIPVDPSIAIDALSKIRAKLIRLDPEKPTPYITLMNRTLKKLGIQFELTDELPVDISKADVGLSSAAIQSGGTIQVYVLPDFTHVLDGEWDEFIEQLSHLLSHELVHRKQQYRIHKAQPNRYDQIIGKLSSATSRGSDYWLNKQEMMAFAKEALMELQIFGLNKQMIRKLLKRPQSIQRNPKASPIFYNYVRLMKDHKDEVKRFFHYLYQYLETA